MLRFPPAPKQDDWVQYLPLAEFSYNNAKHSSTGFTPFELNCGHHPRVSYEDELDPRSRSRAAGVEAKALRELLTECKFNLRDAQESQARYHNKSVKERTYAPGETVWLASRHIKTKRNKKLEDKFLGPFEVIEPVGRQAYRLKLPSRWRIHDVFHVSLLERNTTRKGGADHEMEQLQLEFENENDNSAEFEVEDIRNSAVYTRESEDGRPPGLYYLIHWKDTPVSEDTWEPYAGIKHLRKLVRTFHQDNPQKPTATSDPVDAGPPRPPIAKKSSSSSNLMDLDSSLVPEVSTNIRPQESEQTPPRLGRSRRGRRRLGLDDTVASRVTHRRKTKLASRKARATYAALSIVRVFFVLFLSAF